MGANRDDAVQKEPNWIELKLKVNLLTFNGSL